MKGRMIGFKRFWPSGDGFKGPGNSIMKREETYIPYKERTPKELCRDINLKAEKLFLKNDKFGLLIFAVFFLVLVALHFYYKTYVNLWLGAIVVGAILVVNSVFFLINRRLVNDMNLAATSKQFLPMAKRLKKCFQFRNFLCLSLLFWLPFLILDDFHDVWRIAELLILYILGALFSNRDFWIDPAFSDDVEELEYRLEEQV